LLCTANEEVTDFSHTSPFFQCEHYFLEAEIVEKRRKEKEDHSIEAYESKFRQIQEISGEHDLQKLVDKFIEGMYCSTLLDKELYGLFLQLKIRISLYSITSMN
jgi:hypothetical protein